MDRTILDLTCHQVEVAFNLTNVHKICRQVCEQCRLWWWWFCCCSTHTHTHTKPCSKYKPGLRLFIQSVRPSPPQVDLTFCSLSHSLTLLFHHCVTASSPRLLFILVSVSWFSQCDLCYNNNLLVLLSLLPPQQLTKLHQLAMQQTPFTPLGQTTPAFPGTYPQALSESPSLCTCRNTLFVIFFHSLLCFLFS